VAGLPDGVAYEYDTGGVPLNLQVVARPASGPACQPTIVIDAATVGASGGSAYVTPAPIELTGAGLGRVPFTFAAPVPTRVCAWLYRSPDDVVVPAARDVAVRAPRATVAVTAQQASPGPLGSDVDVRVTGAVEAGSDVFVTVIGAGAACPPTYEDQTDPTALDVMPAGSATRVTGAFDLRFHTRERLNNARWRLCAFLQDGSTAATASTVGTALVDLVLRPTLLARPRARQPRRGAAVTCDGGRWRGRPAPTLTYIWLRGTARIPAATARRLAITAKLRGKAVRCRVTARNAIGQTSATSKPVAVR
jgi:hypothetical protein